MTEVWFVDGDKEQFETKGWRSHWNWIPEQQAYSIPAIEGDVVIPSAFVKLIKHIEV